MNTPTEHRSKEEIASHDARWLNTVTRRFFDEMREPAKRTAPDRTAKARRTPFDETLHDALLIGDKHGVRNLLREELRSLPAPAREAFLKSVKASVRARQPIRVGSTAGEERRGCSCGGLSNDYPHRNSHGSVELMRPTATPLGLSD